VDSGEKEETEISKFRCALYRYAANKNPPEWVTRGIGDVRFLKHNNTNQIRMLLREAKTSLVRMNHAVNPQSSLTPKTGMEDRAWSWFAMDYADETPNKENFSIKFKTADIAQEFKKVYDEARKNNEKGNAGNEPKVEQKAELKSSKSKSKSKDQSSENKAEPKKESKQETKAKAVKEEDSTLQSQTSSSPDPVSLYESRAIEAERLLHTLNLRLTSLEQVLQLPPVQERKSTKPLLLGYWPIRGLAQPIRYLLKFLRVPFEEKRYETNEEWSKDKFSLGIPFPNLPYLFDGDRKLVQSNAILFHIARTYGPHLLGVTSTEQSEVDELLGIIYDFRENWVELCYNEDFAKKLNGYKNEYLPKTLQAFSNLLKSKGDKWLGGPKILLLDFVFYEVLDANRTLVPDCVKAYSNLENYLKRFAQTHEIARYIKDKDFISRPINGSTASFK